MLLNSQYEELMDYAKEELSGSHGHSSLLESLVDVLVCKIEEK